MFRHARTPHPQACCPAYFVLACLTLAFSMVAPAIAQSSLPVAKPTEPISPILIRGYKIDLTLDPAHHSLLAQTSVDFTATQDLATVSFRLNPALHVTDIVDDAGSRLRSTEENGTLRVMPTQALAQSSTATWTFTYSGVFRSDTQGTTVRLASIGDPITYLLYPAHWFPTVGDATGRFTATMHVHVPAGEQVLGSGLTGAAHPDANGNTVYDFDWQRPGFPGTILAGKLHGPYSASGNANVRVYLIDPKAGSGQRSTAPQLSGQDIADTANREFNFFTSRFGPTPTGQMNIVELPDDTLPAAWAPEIAAIAGTQMRAPDSFRLLANTIARQWWGNRVSPATRNDAWITNGMCRYAELQYLAHVSPAAVTADAIFNVSASALAYDKVPLADAARFPAFSSEYEAMTYDKGAMIFRMLQWQIGDTAFEQTLRSMLAQKDGSVTSAQVEEIATAASHRNLQPFFTQWLQYTGAPTLQDKWTLYRLGNNKGFRTVGEIDQDLDLFQMPVEVRIETEGKTVTQRVDVAGPQTHFTIDTFGIPRSVSLDPDRKLLRNGNAMQVRVHILRGMAKAAGNNDAGAVLEYRAALALNALSSLASYRLGEVYFRQHNYQAAEGAFRSALNGDGIPRWIEVWSDLQLGKIFDASGQRDRAVNEYREARETGDNTSGALQLADEYLQHPYTPPHAH